MEKNSVIKRDAEINIEILRNIIKLVDQHGLKRIFSLLIRHYSLGIVLLQFKNAVIDRRDHFNKSLIQYQKFDQVASEIEATLIKFNTRIESEKEE